MSRSIRVPVDALIVYQLVGCADTDRTGLHVIGLGQTDDEKGKEGEKLRRHLFFSGSMCATALIFSTLT